MAIFPGSAIPSAAEDYEIDNSLRFEDSDGAYLDRTPGVAGNRTQFTFSAWVKRANIGSAVADTYETCIFSSGTAPTRGHIRFYEDRLEAAYLASSTWHWYQNTTALFRDPGAWYHIVVSLDTVNTSGKMYVNGTEITAFENNTVPGSSLATSFNNTVEHLVGRRAPASASAGYFDGELAEVYWIDGTIYTPSDFGELDSTTNQWIPKDASGLTFGTNGFYQKYAADGGHTSFLADGTYTTPAGVTSVDYLVIGGGGGGGGFGGGGGAGAYRTGTLSVSASTDYSITVGGGGTGGVFGAGTPSGVGTAGGDSVFSTITSAGGGQGGAPGNRTGYSSAGSGGGGNDGYPGGTGGSYGNNGGGAGTNVGGGGGGASNVGYSGTANTTGGAGGPGTASSITGASVTYAGGGGGGTTATTSGWGGAGGAGGGGAGNATQYGDASHGTANTGGGGGGGGYSDGGNGGSGIVIIKPAAGFGLGLDSSGEGNNFTATNLVATDQMVDTPTNNFATMNPIASVAAGTASVISEGNLKIVFDSSGMQLTPGTIGVSSGKWYWEGYVVSKSGDTQYFGVMNSSSPVDVNIENINPGCSYMSDGQRKLNGSSSSYGDSYTTGDIIGVALNLDDNELKFYKNNTVQNSGTAISITADTYVPVIGRGASTSTWVYNFGSDSSFAANKTAQGNQDGNSKGDFYYAPPTDYVALCTDNLSAPEIALPGENFNTVLWSGDDATSRAITGVGFQPDFSWIKERDGTAYHSLFDSVRGVTTASTSTVLSSNVAHAQPSDNQGHIKTFDSDGFSLRDGTSGSNPLTAVNKSSQTYVGWNWKAGGAPTATNSAGAGATPTAGSVKIDGSNLGSALAGTIPATRLSANTTNGFSIIEYTGTGEEAPAGQTVAHGLSVTPKLLIFKVRDSSTIWYVNDTDVSETSTRHLQLEDTSALGSTYAGYWDSTDPTSSVITLGQYSNLNKYNVPNMIWCFHSVEGYSKIGTYAGNASADGAFVYCGFRPAFLIAKNYGASGKPWVMYDDKRDTYNEMYKQLLANDSAAANTSEGRLDFVSNGIKWRIGDSYHNDGSFIYIAFAESPFKYSNAR